MLDRIARRLVDPWLERPAAALAARNVSASAVTLAGFAVGMAGCLAISQGIYWAGLGGILLNRIADGLDGAVARRTQPSDLGGFLDIVLDLILYASVPACFAWANPTMNLAPACFLIHSYMGSSGTFLAFAVISAKRGVTTGWEGRKSFYYHFGLMEGTETILFMVLVCLFPDYFPAMACVFGGLCWLTTLVRVISAVVVLR